MEREPKPATAGDPPLFVGAMHGVRGFAILVVVLFHIVGGAAWLPNHDASRALIEGSFLALDALFFTTGFVLFLPVALNGGLGNLRAWGVRRFTRIAPAYYVCLLVILLAYPLLAGDVVTAGQQRGVTDYLVHFAFLQQEVLPANAGLGVNGAVWTLSLEVIFYLLLPLVATAYLRRPFVGLAVALGLSAVWRIVLLDPINGMGDVGAVRLGFQFPVFAGDFAAGMTAAWLLVHLRRRETGAFTPGVAAGVAVASLAGLVALIYLAGTNMPIARSVLLEPTPVAVAFPLVLLAFVVSIARAPAWAQWPLTNRASFWFSEISYSVYLYHLLVIFFAFETLRLDSGSQRSFWVLVAVVLPITLVVSALSYRFVERPARRYGRALAAKVSSARRPKAVARSS